MPEKRARKVTSSISIGARDALSVGRLAIGLHNAKKSATTLRKEHEAMVEKRRALLASVNHIVVENGALPDDPTLPHTGDIYDADENAWIDIDEEDELLSNVGGEYLDAETQAALMHVLGSRLSNAHRRTVKSHRERLRAEDEHWAAQMDSLVDAYLLWKHDLRLRPERLDCARSPSGYREPTVVDDSPTQSPPDVARGPTTHLPSKGLTSATASTSAAPAVSATTTPVTSSASTTPFAVPSPSAMAASPVATTEASPMLATAPSSATTSIPSTAEPARDSHMFQLIAVHTYVFRNVNYTGTQCRQFSAAFDAYLAILRRVNARCEVALRRNEEHWRMRNSCPLCTLQLQDEPPMKPERLFAMDGNNSAKRVATAGREDPRSFKSDYFLPRHVVDRFKDEVKRKSQTRSKTSSSADDNEEPSSDEDAPWITEEAPGEAPDGEDCPSPCTERWKASAAEHEKRALNIYETTGIFVCACRHGFVQKACEMVRSGELAKYPLVHVDHVIDVHGRDTGCGDASNPPLKERENPAESLLKVEAGGLANAEQRTRREEMRKGIWIVWTLRVGIYKRESVATADALQKQHGNMPRRRAARANTLAPGALRSGGQCRARRARHGLARLSALPDSRKPLLEVMGPSQTFAGLRRRRAWSRAHLGGFAQVYGVAYAGQSLRASQGVSPGPRTRARRMRKLLVASTLENLDQRAIEVRNEVAALARAQVLQQLTVLEGLVDTNSRSREEWLEAQNELDYRMHAYLVLTYDTRECELLSITTRIEMVLRRQTLDETFLVVERYRLFRTQREVSEAMYLAARERLRLLHDRAHAAVCVFSRAGPRYVTALARAEDLRSTVTSLEREVKRELASLAVGLEEAFREHEEQFPGFEPPQQMEEGEVRRDLEEAAEEMEAEGDAL
ncbi:hypothetical protein ACG7TL_001724 [Trametes sanguinea]